MLYAETGELLAEKYLGRIKIMGELFFNIISACVNEDKFIFNCIN